MSILSKPYPKNSSFKKKVITSLLFGLFIFLFLWVFQPFGINKWEVNYKTLRLTGYGFITAALVFFNAAVIEAIFKKWFDEKNWRVGKELVWVSWNILLIGAANLLYTHYQVGFPLSFFNFLKYQLITVSIGIFPAAIATVANYFRLHQQNMAAAQDLNAVIDQDTQPVLQGAQYQLVTLYGENNKEELVVDPSSLLYIEAADNYINIVWMEGLVPKKQLLRNTLKNQDEKLKPYPYLFRCHRSYLVNLQKVTHVSGNSQGYKLHLAGVEELVPVSRSLNNQIRDLIKKIHHAG
jgi:hypothetical protein